ncbi:ArsR/SmtB family transcription factor [Parvularcula marina]|uniref:Transcriptional regulator n=1 Tax=Parvularcula marina TaxID=2292771 RepID=A0A371RJ71_9PROT|nr:metalloregulator ArsR/SmtB family transcription factor [Parvularcula marina]RFB05500.1 transcriptional regulator [Parvularcula marina]
MEIKDAATGFSALAQTTRLQVLRELVVAGPKGLPAGELAQQVSVPSSTLSFHLKELLLAGLVTSERDGRLIIYRANYSGIHGLVEFLLRDCCSSDKEICGIDDMREAARQALEAT